MLEVYELTLDEALERMKTGEICDAKTIYAIQYWQLALAKGRECHG